MLFIKSLILSVFLSSFIYLTYFDISIKLVDTILALSSIYMLITFRKKELFWSGFFTAIFWFWWIGYSFVYYDLEYLIPIILVLVGVVYGILFYLIALFDNIFYKIIFLIGLYFIEPFGFNWFRIDLMFLNSYLPTGLYSFATIVILTGILVHYKHIKAIYILYFISISGLIWLNNGKDINITKPQISIAMINTDIDQKDKWNPRYKGSMINSFLNDIDIKIKDGYDLVIFPETAFSVALNNESQLLDILEDKSRYIDIVLGALEQKDDLYYNSSYHFSQGKLKSIASKVVLVPFGEAVPLPQKLRDIINDTFYNGAKDYEVAKKPTTFDIKGVKFRNAICYEATTDTIYSNLDTNYIIAISNNGWFTPSIEPVLQKLLMKYYAKKYNVMIFSVNNKSKNVIIKP